MSELPGRRLAINLMMQPGVSTKLLGDEAMKDQGLLSRMLVAHPECNIGYRPFRDASPKSRADMVTYGDRVRWLLETPPPIREGTDGELIPRQLPLSGLAVPLWTAFHDEIERDMRPSGRFATIQGFGSKAAEHAARLAGVITLFDDLNAPEIGPETMAAGIELTRFYLAEALRLFGLPAVPTELREAQDLLDWLQERQAKLVSLVDMYQKGPTGLRIKKAASRSAAILVDHGWLINVPGRHKIDGKWREDVFELCSASDA